MNSSRAGYFQFCVDLGLPANQTALAQHREMNLLVEQIAGTFARHNVTATWATTQSVNSPAANIIQAADDRHEIALLGDNSWLSSSIRREEIINHFTENMRHAAEVGKPLKTLVLRDPAPESLYVIFKKRGIDNLRTVSTQGFSRHSQRDPGLRINGMWVTEATGVFPACGRVLGRFDIGYRGKQILNRSRSKGATEHLSIVAAEMMANPTASLRALDRILNYAAKFAAQGSVCLETMDQTTNRWEPRNAKPQRSVLRPAA